MTKKLVFSTSMESKNHIESLIEVKIGQNIQDRWSCIIWSLTFLFNLS